MQVVIDCQSYYYDHNNKTDLYLNVNYVIVYDCMKSSTGVIGYHLIV